MRTSVDAQLRQEILEQVQQGERPPVLAQKYGVAVGNIYNWINKEKEAAGLVEPKPKREGSTGLALVSLDQQIETLNAKYQKDLKALLLKQIMQSVQAL